MDKLAQYNPEKVMDLLNERLVFERSGVRLYDRILDVIQARADPNIQRMQGELQRYRDEEKAHEEWLEEQVRALGGDAHEDTEQSRLVITESKGIEEVVMNDTALTHLFHALLAAELSDNAGWELLVHLAEEAEDRDASKVFKTYLHEEEEHLLFVRKAVQKLSEQEVLGRDVKMPGSAAGAFY